MEFLKIWNSSGLKELVEKTKRKSPLLSTSGHVQEEGKLNGTILFSGDSFGLCLLNKFTEEKSQQPIPDIKRSSQFSKHMYGPPLSQAQF